MSRTARLRQRSRKTAKWGGLAFFGIIAGACLIGGLTNLGWISVGQYRLVFAGDTCCVMHLDPLDHRASFTSAVRMHVRKPDQLEKLITRSFPAWYWVPRTHSNSWYVHFPLWAPLCVAAVVGVIGWGADLFARRRARIGNCIACGYALDGLPPDALCPECGKPAAVS